MSEQRQKTVQFSFRVPPEIAEKFEGYCERRGITKTQFFENAIRQALGEPLTIPQEAMGKPYPEEWVASVEARLAALEARTGQ